MRNADNRPNRTPRGPNLFGFGLLGAGIGLWSLTDTSIGTIAGVVFALAGIAELAAHGPWRTGGWRSLRRRIKRWDMDAANASDAWLDADWADGRGRQTHGTGTVLGWFAVGRDDSSHAAHNANNHGWCHSDFGDDGGDCGGD